MGVESFLAAALAAASRVVSGLPVVTMSSVNDCEAIEPRLASAGKSPEPVSTGSLFDLLRFSFVPDTQHGQFFLKFVRTDDRRSILVSLPTRIG